VKKAVVFFAALLALAFIVIVAIPWRWVVETKRQGTVLTTLDDGAPVAVTMLQREVEEWVAEFPASRSVVYWKTLIYWTPVLVAHDVRTGALRWERELRRIDERQVAYDTQALAGDGGRVWVFANGIAAIDAATGTTVADAGTLAQANPPLAGVVPTEGKWFEADIPSGKLVVTAADGRIWQLDARTLAATPTTKERNDHIVGDYLRGLSQWSAGRGLGASPFDYTLQGDLLFETRWVGLLTPEEAPRFQPLVSQPQKPTTNPPRRRRLWYADASVRQGITGYSWSVQNLAPAAESEEFLQGGLLRDGGFLRVLRLKGPDGFLVVHTDRLGDAGQYLLSRIDARGTTLWRAAMPLRWIGDLVPLGDTLLMLGPDRSAKFEGEAADLLVMLDLATGRCHAWDFVKAAALATTCAAS
jgi:hypothetical protein